MNRYKVAVIGIGDWGKNILKSVSSLCEVIYVGYSGSEDTKKFLHENYSKISTTTDIETLANKTEVQAVFIATPIGNHYEHVKLFLENSKHVFVEKPLACTTSEVNELYELAERNNCVLFTGYIYLFDEALQKLKDLTEDTKGVLNTFWEKWGSFDSLVTTNLLVHEIATSHYLLGTVTNIISKEIGEDTIKIELQHERGTAVITIDRKQEIQRKNLTFVLPDNTCFTIENGALIKNNKTVLESDTKHLLCTECTAFLKEIETGTSGNQKRQKIDRSVASVLQELASETGS